MHTVISAMSAQIRQKEVFNMKKLGELLKQARENAGLTQPQLATQIGVGIASIRGIEQGYTPTRGIVLAKVEEWIKKQKGGK